MRNASLARVVLVGWVLLAGVHCAWAQDWPQWRGPNRDNKVVGFTEPKTWPKALTKKWKVPVGAGDSSPVLVGDKIYVFGRQGGDEVTLCLDAATGKEIWRDKYETQPADGNAGGIHAGPRSTPAVADGKVCTLGVRGIVSCLDADAGKVVWRKNTKTYPKFYTACSPVIVDGKCIVYADALTAFDLATGESKWRWEGGVASYGSPAIMIVDGVKQIVTPTNTAIVSVGIADGKPLWKAAFSAKYMNNTPIIDGSTVIYSAQGTGTVALKIEKQGDGFVAKELWKKKDSSGQYNTPVLKDGFLYGLSPKPAFYCMSVQTGEVLWTDGTTRGKCGTVIDAGSVLLALTSDKTLIAFQPSNKAFMKVAQYTVADSETWAYPIVAGNRVYVKDQNSLTLWTIE